MAEYKLRLEVAAFAAMMEEELRRKDALVETGEFRSWRDMTRAELHQRLRVQLAKLEIALDCGDSARVVLRCVHAANFLWMLVAKGWPDPTREARKEERP